MIQRQMQSSQVSALRFFLVLAGCYCLSACQQKMASQPSIRPNETSSFFANGQGARPLVPGTVARGHLHTDIHLYTGQNPPQARDWALAASIAANSGGNTLGALATAIVKGDQYVTTFPFPITKEILHHGRNRYMIYCVVCHDALGTGHGKIPSRGYTPPPSYHSDRLREVPVGYMFNVVTKGYGSMPSYSAQIPPRDRWAIVAYVRALQLSQHFPTTQMTKEMHAEWQREKSTNQVNGKAR